MAKSAGFLPNFENFDAESTRAMLTSFMELVRMIRDGDSESDDPWAKQMYSELNG